MQIQCPHCDKVLSEAHIDQDANIVICNDCGTVFSPPSKEKRYLSKDYDDSLHIPARFSVEHSDTRLRITYRRESIYGIAQTLFLAFWNGILWFYFVPMFNQMRPERVEFLGFEINNFPVPLLALLPFIIIGGWMLIYALLLYINRVTVIATGKTLAIINRPIPIPLDMRIATNDIEQIFTRQDISRGKRSTTITYSVHMKRMNGKTKKLIGTLLYPNQALYFERQIEHFLSIENRYVQGQHNQG